MQVDLHEHWFLGGVEIPGRLVLAPMAGVSVQAFRRQGRRHGAGLVCSEMVSVAGIQHRNERTLGYLRVASDEHTSPAPWRRPCRRKAWTLTPAIGASTRRPGISTSPRNQCP